MMFRPAGAGAGVFGRLGSMASNRWAVTLAATGVSFYVLDLVATVAGVALVASGLLGGLDMTWVVASLAASYVFWAFGLHANLGANWDLLERTGASTNCFSKAAYDLAKLGARSDKARKFVSNAGYVGCELVKEAPYYAAAFGAAALSEAITSYEALIFLAGTNIGAACYELGLARATQAMLGRSDGRRRSAARDIAA